MQYSSLDTAFAPGIVRRVKTQQYDTLDDSAITALAHAAMARYPSALQGELRLLCRSENATFVIKSGTQRFALRIHRGNYHEKAEIGGELLWLDALRRDTDIVVPEAIPDLAGERVLTLELADGSQRYAVLFHWIDGEMPTNGVDPRAFQQLGEITARLHRHSRQWRKPDEFERIIWDHHTMVSPQSHWGDWRDVQGLRPADHAIVARAVARVGHELADFGKDPQRYGLIHADLRLTNLLLHDGQTRVIDFDDCGLGWYLHDSAAAISFEEHHPRAAEWVDNWLQGYERVAHISDEEMALLRTFIIQRRIQMTAWVGTHAETQMAQSLGDGWVDHTVRLCRRYLDTDELPVGAG